MLADQDTSQFWLLYILSSSSSSSVSASPSSPPPRCHLFPSSMEHFMIILMPVFFRKEVWSGMERSGAQGYLLWEFKFLVSRSTYPLIAQRSEVSLTNVLCSTASSCWRCKIKMNHIGWFAFHQHPQFLEGSFHLYKRCLRPVFGSTEVIPKAVQRHWPP